MKTGKASKRELEAERGAGPELACSELGRPTGAAHGCEENDEPHDDRPWDDWCRAQGWEGCRDCPACGGSGERDGYGTFEQCPTCGGDGIVDDY